ncbi:MAG: twin-arginine translocase TatA/TatE family subunit [Acidimicrobiia bacterium]
MLAFSLGAPELLILLGVVLLLFGSTQLPKLARSMGQAQREFKRGLDERDPPPDVPASATAADSGDRA